MTDFNIGHRATQAPPVKAKTLRPSLRLADTRGSRGYLTAAPLRGFIMILRRLPPPDVDLSCNGR